VNKFCFDLCVEISRTFEVNDCTVFDLATHKISARVDLWCCISDMF